MKIKSPEYFFEIRQSGPKAKTRQFWFRLVCRNNGEIMFTGERHPTRAKAKRALSQSVVASYYAVLKENHA